MRKSTLTPECIYCSDYTNYLWLIEPMKDLLVCWCFYLAPPSLIEAKVIIEVRYW